MTIPSQSSSPPQPAPAGTSVESDDRRSHLPDELLTRRENLATSGLPTAEQGWLGDVGEQHLRRVRRAAINVLGDSSLGREVLELCDEHAEARRLVLSDRSAGVTVIAVVGATGQGKSWLIRQMVCGSAVAASIRSGNNADEATEKLVWVGPRPPADLDPRQEQFLHCEAANMQEIGVPYLLVDAPGATDDRRGIATVAARAMSLASVQIVVVRRDQLRGYAIGQITRGGEGALVIPVINAVRPHDSSLATDSDALVARLREAAPRSVILPPVIVDDFEVGEGVEAEIGAAAAAAIGQRLQQELGSSWEGDRRRSTRLSALDDRFHAALHGILSDHLPGLTDAVRRLNREAMLLPGQVAQTLIGPDSSLRAAIRSRLRLTFLVETAAIWFPYRSLLGLLNLTHGGWDRLLLSFSGSLPSLVGAAWSGAQNLSQGRVVENDLREGLRRRGAAAVADRLGPLAIRFRDELATLRHDPKPLRGTDSALGNARDDESRSQLAYLAGLDSLQESSQRIFDEEIERVSVKRSPTVLAAVIGTAIFWGLMAGPVVALYRTYLDASYAALRWSVGGLDAFPHPTASTMLTSLFLSLLPTALFAMLALSIAQSRRRVGKAESRIREVHAQTIETLQRDGVLRLRWDDPLLADAEFLLSAGAAEAMESET